MSYANWRRLFNEKIGELRRRDTWTIVFDDSIEPDVLGANVKQYIRGSFAKLWREGFEEKIASLDRKETWTLTPDPDITLKDLGPEWRCCRITTFAKFKCSECSNSWGSAQVLILFHMTLDRRQGRGRVKVRFFKQQCRRCEDTRFVNPEFLAPNIDVILDKLVSQIRKKCYRENLGENQSPFIMDEELEGPHESAHCEACKEGVCGKGYVRHERVDEASGQLQFIPQSPFVEQHSDIKPSYKFYSDEYILSSPTLVLRPKSAEHRQDLVPRPTSAVYRQDPESIILLVVVVVIILWVLIISSQKM
nr:PREDICTED: receptor-transporting protein 3-like [Latimeria chalumnae]|eukprot:XP_014348228.1 PREDICTED: receptor-transporting protein 3-like [Latimeria chalumnae]